MSFHIHKLAIPDVLLIESDVFPDDRGWFAEIFKKTDFVQYGIGPFVQDNQSFSRHGVVRGLHYQLPPMAQGKLVQCVTGEIWDVAVDIRPSSPTFKQWVAETLSGENHRMLYIPEGFAHGFVVTGDHATVIYKVTSEYAPDLDRGIRWDDPDLAIDWPISSPLVSDKDRKLKGMRECEYE